MTKQSGTDSEKDDSTVHKVIAKVENSMFSLAIAFVIDFKLWRRSTPEERLKKRLPKRYHPHVDWLLDERDYTATALLWSRMATAFAGKNGQLVRQHVVLDYTIGAMFSAYLLAWFGLISVVYLTAPQTTYVQNFQAIGSLLVIAIAITLISLVFFAPQRIAKNALADLMSRPPAGDDKPNSLGGSNE